MPLFWLSLGFLSGILASSVFVLPWYTWAGGGIICCGAGFLEIRAGNASSASSASRHNPRWKIFRDYFHLPCFFILAAFAFGGLRFSLAQPQITEKDIAWYNDRGMVRVQGVVEKPPQYGEKRVQVTLAVQRVSLLEGLPQEVGGDLLVSLPPTWRVAYGDTLEVEGKLNTPSEDSDFSYRQYLANKGIYATLYAVHSRTLDENGGNLFLRGIYRLRVLAYQSINQFFPQPESAIINGILLGIDDDMAPSLVSAFRETGTSHILVISGFNITILASLFFNLFRRFFSRIWAGVVAIGAIICYTFLVGGEPSVVRAAIMGSMSIVAQLLGRSQGGFNALTFSGAVLCAFNPMILWDLSFQLTFSATLGMLAFANRFQSAVENWLAARISRFAARSAAGLAGEYFFFTLAAQLTTLPVLIYHFQEVSIIAFLANPLILPVQPLLMILSGITLLAGIVLPPLGQLLAGFTWPLAAYTHLITEYLARAGQGMITVPPIALWQIGIYYLLLWLIVTRHASLFRQVRRTLLLSILLLGSALLSSLFIRQAVIQADHRLRLTWLNVAEGSAMLIQPGNGNALLIDGDSSGRELGSTLAKHLSPLRRGIDGLMLTRSTASNLKGIPWVIEHNPTTEVYINDQILQAQTLKTLFYSINNQEVPVSSITTDSTLLLDNEKTLRILKADKKGMAYLIGWNDFSAYVPGGIPKSDMLIPKECEGRISLLLLSRQDITNAPIEKWLSFSPQVIWYIDRDLIDAPAQNWFNIAQHGWLQASSDGNLLWLESER